MPKQPVLYEAMYIIDSALEESAVEGIVTTLEGHIRDQGGEVVATHEFGRRRLAFEIDGHTSGTYKITYFKSHGPVVDEVVHEMKLIDGIVRGIVVVANPRAIFEPQAIVEAEATEPDMALAEATTGGVSAGEAVAESEGAAVEEAEAEVVEGVAEADAAGESEEGEEPAAEEA